VAGDKWDWPQEAVEETARLAQFVIETGRAAFLVGLPGFEPGTS
jgi:hypothetical protein